MKTAIFRIAVDFRRVYAAVLDDWWQAPIRARAAAALRRVAVAESLIQ